MKGANENQYGGYRRWTKREVRLLKSSYALSKGKRIINWLPELKKTRNPIQCSNKAVFLGIRRKQKGGYKNFTEVNKIFTKEELNYLTGIFDGEGYIDVRPQTTSFKIGITNTSENLMKWLSERIKDGKIQRRKLVLNLTGTGYRKQQYEFEIYGMKSCYSFLKAMFPYSIIKKDKIKEALRELNKKLK